MPTPIETTMTPIPIYECNFDTATTTNHCFTTSITIASTAGIVGSTGPTGPQSDVTGSCKKNQHFIVPYI
jgi:hypothetical protein